MLKEVFNMAENFSDQELVRRQKMEELRAKGIDPFGKAYHRTHRSRQLRELFGDKTKEELEEINQHASIAGRIMSKRRMGKIGFMHLQDRDGQIQVVVNKGTVGEDVYEIFKASDIGDIHGDGRSDEVVTSLALCIGVTVDGEGVSFRFGSLFFLHIEIDRFL